MTASTEARVSPLAGWTLRFAAASTLPARFAIRELPFTTQINLRGDASDKAVAAAVSGALRLGPDEWMFIADGGDVAVLEAALRGTHHSVVDVAASRTVIELAGADARAVLAKGCALDLHTTVFGADSCAQTLLAKAQVILHCAGEGLVFHLYVRNSYADYLASWLVDAAAETAASRVAFGLT